jgi:hypothetical protein
MSCFELISGDGDKGALLRRAGLYSSHVVEWRPGPGQRGSGWAGGAADGQGEPPAQAAHRRLDQQPHHQHRHTKEKLGSCLNGLDRFRLQSQVSGAITAS